MFFNYCRTANFRVYEIFANFCKFAKISCSRILPSYSTGLYLSPRFYRMKIGPPKALQIASQSWHVNVRNELLGLECTMQPVFEFLNVSATIDKGLHLLYLKSWIPTFDQVKKEMVLPFRPPEKSSRLPLFL